MIVLPRYHQVEGDVHDNQYRYAKKRASIADHIESSVLKPVDAKDADDSSDEG